VSNPVQENIRVDVDISLEDAAEQQLKNMAQPVRVYHVRAAKIRLPSAAACVFEQGIDCCVAFAFDG